MRKRYHHFIVILILVIQSHGQNSVHQTDLNFFSKQRNTLSLILPAVLIGLGVAGLRDDELLTMNFKVKDEVGEEAVENGWKKVKIDNVTQYLPFISVIGLNISGIKGRSNWKDRSVMAAASCFIMGSTVYGLKKLVKEERPDKSGLNSFPSGHTATAFAGAEFLWQEYKNVSTLYGISGYVVATGTGLFRVYNNKHWATDVFAGAGIGILSTKIVYMLYPVIVKRENRKDQSAGIPAITSYANDDLTGIKLNLEF